MKKYYLLFLLVISSTLTTQANDNDIKFINLINNFETGTLISNKTSDDTSIKILLCSLDKLTEENYNFCISFRDKEIDKNKFSLKMFEYLNIQNTKYNEKDIKDMLF